MPDYFTSSYGRIAYLDSKSGVESLILMHGLPTSKELWTPVLTQLQDRYRIITFDLNDYGQSDKLGQPISHKQRAAVLDELRDHIGLHTFILVAHDLGASVAVDYMGSYAERVKKLVLISPPVYPDFVEPALVKLVRKPRLGELLVRASGKPLIHFGIRQGCKHKERLTSDLLHAFSSPFQGEAGQAALLRVLRWGKPADTFRDYPQIIRSIQIPTLILHGCEDPYIPGNQATRLHAEIPVSTRLVFIEDGSHFLPIDTPEAVAREIRDFVAVEQYLSY